MELTATFAIPVSFVLENATPSPGQMAVGLAQGWVRPADVIAVATSAVAEQNRFADAYLPLACLLTSDADDLRAVPDLLPAPACVDDHDEALWRHLAVALVFAHRAAIPRWMLPGGTPCPWTELGALVVDAFGNPREMDPLLPWTPAEPPSAGGIALMEQCYRDYLTEVRTRLGDTLR